MKASQLLLGCIIYSVFLPSAFAQSSRKPSGKAPDKTSDKTAAAPAPAPVAAKEPLATVDGQPMTEEDLDPLVAGQLRPLRDQEYQIKKKALDGLIGQKVVETKATKTPSLR